MDETVRNILKAEPWEKHMRRLTAFAMILFDMHQCSGIKPSALRSMDPVDFAMQAIEDVYGGKRAWDAEKYPNLYKHLEWVVRSLISNAVRSAASSHGSDAAPPEHGGNDSDDDVILAFHAYLADEPDLQRIVECVYYGHLERVDIAGCAEITQAQMTNARKRLQRRWHAYRAAH